VSTRKDKIESISTWYLIYTKPKQEKLAEAHLVRQGYHVYLPLFHSVQRRQGRYQTLIEPMFPRYLFICLNASTDNWAPIRSTRGVTSLVQFGGVPAKVPIQLIKLIMEDEQRELTGKPKIPQFKQGENIQILDGVMAGYQGIVAEKNGTKRVTVLLNIVGKSMKVEVPIDSIARSK